MHYELNPEQSTGLHFAGTARIAATILAGIAVGALAAKLQPALLAMALTGSLALLLSILRPDLALSLFFCGVIFLTDSSPNGGHDYFAIADFDIITGLPSVLTSAFLMITGIAMARSLINEHRLMPCSLTIPAIFSGILLIALVIGLTRGADRSLLRVDFMDMLFPVLCFYLCQHLLNTHERIWRLLNMMMVVAGLKAAILSVAYLAGHGWHYGTYRVVTTDSADLLIFITLALMALHLLVRREIRGVQTILYSAASIPMLFAIIFSYRRAQWGGFLLSLGLLFWGASNIVRRRLVFISLLSFLAASCLMVLVVGLKQEAVIRISSRLESIFDTKQSSNRYHALESLQVLKDLSKSPISGLGLGSKHSPLGLYEDDLVPTNVVHNAFLYIWMKMGLSGLIFFLVAGGRFLHSTFRTCRQNTEGDASALLLPIAASSGLWLAMFLTGPTPWYFHETAMIAMFAAIGMNIASDVDHNLKTGQAEFI